MDDVKRRRWKWKRWAAVLLIVTAFGGWILNGNSPAVRAGKVQVGMSREDVHRIMGPSQMRFRIGAVIEDGTARLEIGECWDDGGALKANFDHWRRKLGLLNSFKTRGQHAVEIRFDTSDRVVAIEIRDDSMDGAALEGMK